jgi:hypothetical protein
VSTKACSDEIVEFFAGPMTLSFSCPGGFDTVFGIQKE